MQVMMDETPIVEHAFQLAERYGSVHDLHAAMKREGTAAFRSIYSWRVAAEGLSSNSGTGAPTIELAEPERRERYIPPWAL